MAFSHFAADSSIRSVSESRTLTGRAGRRCRHVSPLLGDLLPHPFGETSLSVAVLFGVFGFARYSSAFDPIVRQSANGRNGPRLQSGHQHRRPAFEAFRRASLGALSLISPEADSFGNPRLI
jgi:hypothetical protein